MAKVSIVSPENAAFIASPEGVGGSGKTFAYLQGEKHPIHVFRHELALAQTLVVDRRPVDSLVYVWEGAILAADRILERGSSLMIEQGATVEVVSQDAETVLISFAASHSITPAVATPKIHLLAANEVPRYDDGAVAGGLYADASLSTCSIWLHENRFAPPTEPTRSDAEAGIHSHDEDEVILVTDGQIRLGARLYGRGTLLAVAAKTMYSFTVGPGGARFINFRPGRPDEILFKNGVRIDEVGYWRSRVPQPEYVSLAAGVAHR